jgi:uncharacterized membrane protein YedE/YeeE
VSKPENDASPPLPLYQFRLRYLIYLVTLAAIGSAVLRHLFDIGAGYQFGLVMSVYVVVLIAYFAFRFPLLVGRLTRSRRKLTASRKDLRDFANQARKKMPPE